MSDNFAKLWVQRSANQLAINRARQAIENMGRALPCRVVKVTGSIVTVAFEVNAAPFTLPNITIPKAESNWIRMPTQIDDFGMTMPADAYLGGVSGLGGGVATLTRPGNLSALVFVPVSNSGSGPIDQNAAQVQGPNGAIIRTTTGTTSEIVTNTSGTTVTFGANTVVVNETETALNYGTTSLVLNASGITMTFGASTIVFNGSGLSINGALYETHTHPYLPGGGDETETGPPQG